MKLQIGDRIRITAIPDWAYIHPDTIKVFEKLVARNRSVRISAIDDYGNPRYECRFRNGNGVWEYHYLAILEGENNWIKVKSL